MVAGSPYHSSVVRVLLHADEDFAKPGDRFLRKRSLAQGIASSGSGIVGVIYAVATIPMIENLGLPWALRITGTFLPGVNRAKTDHVAGITSFVMLFLSTVAIRDRNTHIKPIIKPFDMDLLRQTNVSIHLYPSHKAHTDNARSFFSVATPLAPLSAI
jgi:hypothetical protein